MTTTLIAAIASFLGGGVVFKTLADRISMTKKEQYTSVIMLVERLQKDIDAQAAKLKALDDKCTALEKEVDHWRELYYSELEQKIKLADEVRKLTNELKKYNKNNS